MDLRYIDPMKIKFVRKSCSPNRDCQEGITLNNTGSQIPMLDNDFQWSIDEYYVYSPSASHR